MQDGWFGNVLGRTKYYFDDRARGMVQMQLVNWEQRLGHSS